MSESTTLDDVVTNEEHDVAAATASEAMNAPSVDSAETAAPPSSQAGDDEDLEDGEIDDDDDDDNDDNAVIVVAQQSATAADSVAALDEKAQQTKLIESGSNKLATDNIVTIDLSHDSAPTPPPSNVAQQASVKSKKPQPVEDDHASSIENAIASALKKKGIEPPMPKMLESRNGQLDKDAEAIGGQSQSRSSRRRKRKKQRDDKDKERKEKKKHRFDSPEPAAYASGPPPLDDDDDMDDYEMMNVRGGSPPPVSANPAPLSGMLHSYKDIFDSPDNSYSSDDSYESGAEGAGADGAGSRRRRRGKKESRKRRGRNRDDERNGRQDKRNRRDSDDDKHRQEPRKLELCKFYLMECCAKKDKCSYMHADFPCKYHYLGMECVYKDACKFSHGAPLSEQLRNILLKHLETAPKEILGNFKRISRENAILLITKRHEELCKQYKVENTWSPMNPLGGLNQSRRGGGSMSEHNQQQYMAQQQQQQQQQLQQQLQQLQQQQQTQTHTNIPSLLDMVINPPPIGNALNAIALSNIENKLRKSRWTETMGAGKGASSMEPASGTEPSYLDLKNATGILSAEHIEKLSQLGITNLDQVNQLTVGQLNQIGLTIAEIGEIQRKATNMNNLSGAGDGANSTTTNAADGGKTTAESNIPTNRDVDMRFLPSAATTTTKTATTSKDNAGNNNLGSEKDTLLCSNSSSNSSTGVVMVDYSQYLKDSNLSFDRGDIYDDEKDDEQLVIDDGNLDSEEQHAPLASTASAETNSLTHEERKTEGAKKSDLAHRLQMADFTNALKNPFNSSYANEHKKDPRHRDPRAYLSSANEQQKQRNPFKMNPFQAQDDDSDADNAAVGDERFNARSRRSRSRSRSRSRTPTRSQSSTPEASQSPEPEEPTQPTYERVSMYDFSARVAEEDEARRASSSKADKDMRLLPGSNDIDLRLPFQPVMNYTPATEIDGSITSHLPMTYKVYEVDVPRASYMELRQNFKSDQTSDPRLRRILGLPELSQTRTSAALSRSVRKLSNSIASPESEGASPKYYTPPSSFGTSADERLKSTKASSAAAQPRLDPRRAAVQGRSNTTAAAAENSSSSAASSSGAGAMKQNVEIRNLLQKSEWYKNLNSKFKIMVNQQLALVSTELKKFHQDNSPNKIFDISFIVNNSTLQQILTNLGIYIDDNGEVAHVDADNDEAGGGSANNIGGIALPNLSQPPPTQQLDFLRAPPPNMAPPHMFRSGSMNGPPPMNMPPFGALPNARPSLLGMPPGNGGNPFNPFASNMPDMGGINPNFVGGPGAPGLMGPMPGVGPFGNFGAGMPPNMQQRNFGGGNNQRNRNQRRNFGGGSNKI